MHTWDQYPFGDVPVLTFPNVLAVQQVYLVYTQTVKLFTRGVC